MPDDSLNKNASVQPPPHIAESAPMEMSVPIEQVGSGISSIEPSAQLAPPASKLPPSPTPLSENVAPFASSQPVVPEVEYVQLAPVTLRPESPPAPITRPIVPKPTRTSVVPPHGRSPVPLPRPMSVPQQPPQPAPPVVAPPPAFITSPISSLALPQQPNKARTIYSHNSKDVWHFQSSTRQIYVFIGIVVAVTLGALFVYWLSLGAPSRIENIPLVHRLVNL